VRGSVLWVLIDDPNGSPILDEHGNPKPHPTVVLTPTEDIVLELPITIAAISTRFDPENLLPGEFLIPSRPGGHPVTGLDQPCVVKAYWLKSLDKTKITRAHPRERAPAKVVRQVLNWLAQNLRT
jgi:hypothetical protein